jgi:hypothetical protein
VASVLTGKTEPGKTDYATFKTYWNNEVGNVFGNLPYDSLAVHFYMFRDDIIDGSGINSARLNEMSEWKTEAQGEGYKVQVTEYGVIPTISFQACDEACVAAQIDEIHDGIITSLSGVYRQLMWYSFSDADITSGIDWERVSAFYDNGGTWQLKSPVGTT